MQGQFTGRSHIPRCIRILLIWLLLIHWPFVIGWLPPLHMAAFVQAMFWINIPGLPMAERIGLPHFKVEEFGALPQDAFAWSILFLFWLIVALCLTAGTELAIWTFCRMKRIRIKASNEPMGGDSQ